MTKELLGGHIDFEEEMAYELGAGKIRKKIKKGLKAVATGGISLAAKAIKKKVQKTKVAKVAKKVAAKVKALAAKPKVPVAKPKTPVAKLSAKSSPKAPAAARKVIKKVQEKTAGDCTCKEDLAKLVAAKLVAQLGPPIDEANRILAKFALQRQATYEHQKLMTDSEFRRQVLAHIADKAAHGNRACQRTLKFFRS